MKLYIPFLIAILVHITFLFAGKVIFEPPEVYFQPGESVIEIKLVASIASPESRKQLTIETNDQDDIEKTENRPESKKELPKEVPTPAEPEIVTETEQEPAEDELVEEKDAILEKISQDKAQKVSKNNIQPETDVKTDKLNERQNQKIEKTAVKYKVPEKKVLPVENGVNETDTVPSTESVADLLDKGISSPSITGVEKPKYPRRCRKLGHEGVCILEVTIDAEGNCIDINVSQSAGCPKLDKSAIKVLKKASFSPAKRFGIKIRGTKKLAFRFKIEDIE